MDDNVVHAVVVAMLILIVAKLYFGPGGRR